MFVGNATNLLDVGQLPKKMNRHDRLGFRRDRGFDLLYIDIECGWIDIDEDWNRPNLDDRLHARYKSERRGNDLVAWPNPRGFHHDSERVCAAIDGDCMLNAVKLGDLFFEGLVVLAQYKRSTGNNLM